MARIAKLIVLLILIQSIIAPIAVGQVRDPIAELTAARRVYVPVEELDVVMERDKKAVLLPRTKFEALLTQARANADRNAIPDGISVLMTAADYAVTIVGDQLAIAVTAEIMQFDNDWHELQFPLQRLSMEQATIDDTPALVGRLPDGSVSLFVNTRGKHILKLQLSTELTAYGSDRSAAFSLLRAPSGTLSVTLPAGKRLIAGNLKLERPAPLEQPAEYKISVGGVGGMQLRITDRETSNSADSLLFATTGYGLSVSPGEVTCHLLTSLQVFGKPIDRLTISVPKDLEVADIEAPGLEAWDFSDNPKDRKRKQIRLTFGQPFEGNRKIALKGVMAVESGQSWDAPSLRIDSVTSHIGQVVVQYPVGIRLRIEETTGVRRATREQKPAADMPDDPSVTNAMEFLRFDAWQPDFTLRLSAQPKQREVQSAVAAVLDINSTGLDLQAALTVATKFAPLFEVDVRIPSDWQIVDVQSEGNSIKWQLAKLDEAGVNQMRALLTTPIAAGTTGKLQVTMRRDVEGWPVEAEPVIVALPQLILPQSNLTESEYVVRADADLDLVAFDTKGLDPQPLKADYERLRFQSQDTRFEAKLQIARKPSSISVQTVTFGRIDPQTFHAFLQAIVDVRGGGTRSLRIALPETTGTSVRFHCANLKIVEQKSAPPANGERIWTLSFGQRLRGQAPIVCDLELPRGELNEFSLPLWRFVDAERQTGFIVTEAGGEQRLTIVANEANGTPLAEADPLELPNLFYRPKERIVGVHRSTAAGAIVTLSEQRFEKIAVPTAVCPSLEISTILGRTGEMQHQATFRLKAVGVQGLHAILPSDATLWAATVDGQPVEVRRMGDVYLIPLIDTGRDLQSKTVTAPSADGNFVVQIFYRTQISPLSQFGTLSQVPPVLTVETGQRTAMPVEVLSRTWNLNYPEETRLIDSRSELEPERPLDVPSYLGKWNSAFHVPSGITLRWQLLFVSIALVFAFVVSNLLNQQRTGAAATVIAVCAVAVSLMLFRPSFLSEGRMGASKNLAPFLTESLDSKNVVVELSAPKDFTIDFADKKLPAKAAPAAAPVANVPGLAINPVVLADDDQVEVPVGQKQEDQDNKPANRSGKDSKRKAASGLMSLGIDFVPPAGSRSLLFRYIGSDTSPSGIPLDIDYVDSNSGVTTRIFMMAIVIAIGWFVRRIRMTVRLGLAVLGIAAPLALAPIVSVGWQIVLDGIFFGTLIAVGVCLIWTAIAKCRCCCCCWPSSTATTTATIAIILLSAGTLAAADNAKLSLAETSLPKNTIFVPYDAGTDPLASDRVLLSHEQFTELYRLANPDRSTQPTATEHGGLLDALYSATLAPNVQNPEQSVVRVTARYAVRSLVEGQMTIEMPLGQINPTSAKLDDKLTALISNGNRLAVAVSKPGFHVVDLTFEVPAKVVGDTGSFTVPLLPVAAGKFAFRLPGKDLAVRINGSSTVFRRVTNQEAQSVELPIDKGGEIAISWQPQQTSSTETALVQLESVRAIVLSDLGGAISDSFGYRTRQGGIAETSFSLPDTLRLQSVNGPDVGGWEVQGTGADRKLRVTFRRNVTDQTRLTIDTFLDAKIDTESVVVSPPQVAPLGIANEIGQIAVFAENQFLVRAEQVESLSQLDAEKFATTLPVVRPNVPPQLVFRFSKRPYGLGLRVTRQESSAHVMGQHAALIVSRKQQLTTRLRYNITGSPRSALSIRLPEAFVLLDVQATGLRDWFVVKEDDDSLLTVELNAPSLGLVEVTISGFAPREGLTASLIFPQPIDATRIDSTAAIWLDEGFVGTLGTTDGWRSIDVSQLSSELSTVRSSKPASFAFSSNLIPPTPIGLKLTALSPKLSANGLSMVTVTDLAVVYTLAFQWQIDSAKTEILTLTTPGWLAGKLDFQADGLRDVSQTKVDGDRVRWNIQLRSPVSGKFFATATATLPPATKEVLAPSVVFERDAKPLEMQRQFVLLINSSTNQLIAADPSLVESVQPQDVPVNVQQADVDRATEFVRVKTPLAAPKWAIHTFQQQSGALASVNVADLTTVVSRDGTYRSRAIYTIKNRSRQFLAIRMPEGTDLLSVFVADLPSRAVAAKLTSQNGATVQLIALPKTSAAGLSFPVSIVWRGRLSGALPKSAKLASEELSFPAPRILSQQDDADYGIPVARTRWSVYLPDDLDAQPVKSTSKHNLSVASTTDNLYGYAVIQETEELLEYLDQTIASNRRNQSRNNLRQIELTAASLNQIADQDLAKMETGSDSELSRRKAELIAKVEAAKREAIAERQSTVQFFSKLEAQAKPGTLNRETEELSEGQIIANNQQQGLIMSNASSSIELSSTDEQSILWGSRFGLLQPSSKTNAGHGAPSTSKTMSEKLGQSGNETRQQLRDLNKSNIDSLNSQLTNNAISRRTNLSRSFQAMPNQQVEENLGQIIQNQNNSIFSANSGGPFLTNSVVTNFDNHFGLNVQPQGGDPLHEEFFKLDHLNNSTPDERVPQAAAIAGLQLRGVPEQMGRQKDRDVAFGEANANGGAGAAGGRADIPNGGNRESNSRQTRGLSLPFELPKSGREYVFTKSGGDPKLTLAIRSHESIRWGIRFVWSAVWIAFGVFALLTLRNAHWTNRLVTGLPAFVAVIGVLGYFVLPEPVNGFGFLVFVIATFAKATRRLYSTTENS